MIKKVLFALILFPIAANAGGSGEVLPVDEDQVRAVYKDSSGHSDIPKIILRESPKGLAFLECPQFGRQALVPSPLHPGRRAFYCYGEAVLEGRDAVELARLVDRAGFSGKKIEGANIAILSLAALYSGYFAGRNAYEGILAFQELVRERDKKIPVSKSARRVSRQQLLERTQRSETHRLGQRPPGFGLHSSRIYERREILKTKGLGLLLGAFGFGFSVANLPERVEKFEQSQARAKRLAELEKFVANQYVTKGYLEFEIDVPEFMDSLNYLSVLDR